MINIILKLSFDNKYRKNLKTKVSVEEGSNRYKSLAVI